MIDLYAAGTSNGMRARIALEECGLPYKLNFVDLAKGEHKTPQFLAMNPNGQIPVIVDHEGPGGKPLTLSQSTAILLYCAEKSGKFLPKDPAARAGDAAGADERLDRRDAGLRRLLRRPTPRSRTRRQRRCSRTACAACSRSGTVRSARASTARGDEMTVADLSLYAGYCAHQGRGAGRRRGPAEPGALGRGDGARARRSSARSSSRLFSSVRLISSMSKIAGCSALR